jgi:uncharacterized membrane protein
VFRTYALDLGAYTNALFDYINFQWNDSTVFKEIPENLLADHFDLYLIILSPLSFVFGTYTLLVVQILAILAGGIGVYKLLRSKNISSNLAWMGAIYFYLFFGVFSALSFDYHSNVVAAAILPFFFLAVQNIKLRNAGIILLLILISKENVSLWMAFVCLGLVLQFWSNKKLRNWLMIATGACAVYFVLITGFVMPALSNSGEYPHFHYSVLGENGLEALGHIFRHPIDTLELLFINHSGIEEANCVKAELHILLLLSGLPLLLFRPQFLIMLIPIYFQKLMHDNFGMWGITGQYSIEFAPILAIGIFSVISSFKKHNMKWIITFVVLTGVLTSTIRRMDNTVLFTKKEQIRFYKQLHYSQNFEVSAVHDLLNNLPKDAIVSAQSSFLPHLALRDKVYQFPMVKDAEYIVLSESENPYPMEKEDFEMKLKTLGNSGEWEVLHDREEILIMKRK